MVKMKRFEGCYAVSNHLIQDNEGKIYEMSRPSDVQDIVDLLNEREDKVNHQEDVIKILQQEIQDTQRICEMLSEKLKGYK